MSFDLFSGICEELCVGHFRHAFLRHGVQQIIGWGKQYHVSVPVVLEFINCYDLGCFWCVHSETDQQHWSFWRNWLEKDGTVGKHMKSASFN